MSDAALLERVDALLEQASSADGLSEVMAVVREAFDADRAWLDFPCDPDSPSFLVVAEACAPEFPGLGSAHTPVPVSRGMRQVMQDALDSDGAVASIGWQPAGVSFETAQHFDVRTRLCMAIRPPQQAAWLFGLHSCRTMREWTPHEAALFSEIAARVTRRVSTALLLDLIERESERRVTLSHALRLSGALGGEHDPRSRLAHEFNNVLGIVTGFSDLALLALEQGDHTRVARHLNEVLKAGERGRDLVTELTASGPQAENEASPSAPTHDAPHLVSRDETGVPHLGRRIMIVDDEEAVGRFVAEVLHRHGFDVSTTTNPRTAAALLRAEAESIDLLITDYRMPEMSGTELMAATHAIRADLPVIICTGYSKDVNASIAREMGAAAFLNKPLNIDVLLSEVHAALNTPAA